MHNKAAYESLARKRIVEPERRREQREPEGFQGGNTKVPSSLEPPQLSPKKREVRLRGLKNLRALKKSGDLFQNEALSSLRKVDQICGTDS